MSTYPKPDDHPDGQPTARPHRRRAIILVALAVLPVVFTAAAQPFLPDTVPVHYGLGGPDSWGPKSELFVAAGITTVLGLFIAALFAVFEHQRATGREDWIVFNDGTIGMSFPLCVIVLAVLGVAQSAYVAGAFGLAGFVLPANLVQWGVDVLFGLVVLAMWGFSAYMIVTGKSLLNFRPNPSELELHLGDDKRQARAIGALLLLLSIFVLVEWGLMR